MEPWSSLKVLRDVKDQGAGATMFDSIFLGAIILSYRQEHTNSNEMHTKRLHRMDLSYSVNSQLCVPLRVETLLSCPGKWIPKWQDKLLTKTLPFANVVGKRFSNQSSFTPTIKPK